MKHLIAIVFFGFCSQVSGDIYSYIDPITGAKGYTNQAKKGAVRMNTGDTLSEIPSGATNRYKCRGEPGLEWELKPEPAVGCFRLNDDQAITSEEELRAEVARLKAESAAQAARAAQGVAYRKKRAGLAADLNRKWPGSCIQHDAGGWMCFPRVGMNVDTHENILGLRKLGYTEDSVGKFERWGGNCRVTSRGKRITAVVC